MSKRVLLSALAPWRAPRSVPVPHNVGVTVLAAVREPAPVPLISFEQIGTVMPTSIREGKDWLIPRITAHLPGSVLDVGAGEGTYRTLLDPAPAGSFFTALEVFEPYVREFSLDQLYDKVIVADARYTEFPTADVVILGDVIEHLEFDDARTVWDKARRAARKAVFASIPLGVHPQGAVNGNEHERHLTSWTNELVLGLGGVTASWTGAVIGCYEVSPQ